MGLSWRVRRCKLLPQLPWPVKHWNVLERPSIALPLSATNKKEVSFKRTNDFLRHFYLPGTCTTHWTLLDHSHEKRFAESCSQNFKQTDHEGNSTVFKQWATFVLYKTDNSQYYYTCRTRTHQIFAKAFRGIAVSMVLLHIATAYICDPSISQWLYITRIPCAYSVTRMKTLNGIDSIGSVH